jgi:hypothetical protein
MWVWVSVRNNIRVVGRMKQGRGGGLTVIFSCYLFVRLRAPPRLFSDSTLGRLHVLLFATGQIADMILVSYPNCWGKGEV